MDQNATKKTALFVSTLGAFLTPFGTSSLNIALPTIGKEFAMDAILLSWVVTAYILPTAICQIPFGRIADIYGRKRIFTYGILIYTIASFSLIICNSTLMLIVLRIFHGIGSAMIYTNGVAILTSVYPISERGKVLGINVAAVYLGLSLGPVLGGSLTQHFGWRSIFLMNVILGIIIIISTFWKLKGEWAEAGGERVDFIGSIIFCLMLTALMYGFSLLPNASGAWLILLSVLGGLAFVKWETKVESPVLDIHLFQNNRAFIFSNLAALIHYSATFAIGFLLSLYLQYIKGFSPQSAGLILVSQAIMQAVFSPMSGKLSDRIEPRIVASMGMGLTAMGLFLLAFLNEKTTLTVIIGSLALLGFGFGLFSSPNTNAVMSCVEKRFYGVASGILGTMRHTGQMFSMGTTMLIFGIYIGKVQITPEYYPLFLKSMKGGFAFFAVLCFGGFFASLARGKVR